MPSFQGEIRGQATQTQLYYLPVWLFLLLFLGGRGGIKVHTTLVLRLVCLSRAAVLNVLNVSSNVRVNNALVLLWYGLGSSLFREITPAALLSECPRKQNYKRTDEHTNERMNKRTNDPINGQSHEQSHKRTKQRNNKRIINDQ